MREVKLLKIIIMIYKWKYNGKIYDSRKDFKDIFGWSTCKIDAKIKDGKIIKITEENTYEDKNTICKNT